MSEKNRIIKGPCKGVFKRSRCIGRQCFTHDSKGAPLSYPYSKSAYERKEISYKGEYEVFINLAHIESMVAKAASNKNKKCVDGPVIVQVKTVETVILVTKDPVTTGEEQPCSTSTPTP